MNLFLKRVIKKEKKKKKKDVSHFMEIQGLIFSFEQSYAYVQSFNAPKSVALSWASYFIDKSME